MVEVWPSLKNSTVMLVPGGRTFTAKANCLMSAIVSPLSLVMTTLADQAGLLRRSARRGAGDQGTGVASDPGRQLGCQVAQLHPEKPVLTRARGRRLRSRRRCGRGRLGNRCRRDRLRDGRGWRLGMRRGLGRHHRRRGRSRRPGTRVQAQRTADCDLKALCPVLIHGRAAVLPKREQPPPCILGSLLGNPGHLQLPVQDVLGRPDQAADQLVGPVRIRVSESESVWTTLSIGT